MDRQTDRTALQRSSALLMLYFCKIKYSALTLQKYFSLPLPKYLSLRTFDAGIFGKDDLLYIAAPTYCLSTV